MLSQMQHTCHEVLIVNILSCIYLIRPNKVSVFWVMGLKILGRHKYIFKKNLEKYNFMDFERHFAFQNA